MFSKSGICFDFVSKLAAGFLDNFDEVAEAAGGTVQLLLTSTTNTVIVQGEFQILFNLRSLLTVAEATLKSPQYYKVWITTADVDFTSVPLQRSWDLNVLHGSISLAMNSDDVSGFYQFLKERNPSLVKEDGSLREIWQQAFNCFFSSFTSEMTGVDICTGKEQLETLSMTVFEMQMTAHSYSVYNAVYAIVHALHAMKSSVFNQRLKMDSWKQSLNQQVWKVLPKLLVSHNLLP